MAKQGKKPKNRFLPGAHVSEMTLARILFCWLNGELYSDIPTAITENGGAVDAAIERLFDILGEGFNLAENNRNTISRQASHSIIAEVSLQIISRNYIDRTAHLEDILAGDDPSLELERRRVIALVGSEPSEEERAELLAKMRAQSVEDYITRWGKIVIMLSANVVPYEAMRAIEGVKPLDLIQNPIILERMQERYRNFRGYKVPALKTHIAQYFCLRNGADFLMRDGRGLSVSGLHTANKKQKTDYWSDCVVCALICLLLQLETGLTYYKLRANLFGSDDI